MAEVAVTQIAGVWALEEPRDLLAKLRSDVERFREAPFDSHVAFDVFMTGYHLVDWVLPGDERREERKALIRSNQWLQLAGSVANFSKHRLVTRKTWESEGWAAASAMPAPLLHVEKNTDGSATVYSRLLAVHVRETDVEKFGEKEIFALDAAEELLLFWEAYFGERQETVKHA